MGAAEVKAALNVALGTNAKSYWRVFSNFLSGRTARAEFEDSVRQYLNTQQLGESPVLDSEVESDYISNLSQPNYTMRS